MDRLEAQEVLPVVGEALLYFFFFFFFFLLMLGLRSLFD